MDAERRADVDRRLAEWKAINREAKLMLARHDRQAQRANFPRCGCEDCRPFRAVYEQGDEPTQTVAAVDPVSRVTTG